MHTTEALRDGKPFFRHIHPWWGWGLCFLGIFFIYLSNSRAITSADNVALRYLPLSLIREGNFDLNEFSFLYANKIILYPIIYHNGHFLSFAPVGPSLLALPFYLIPTLAGISAESVWLPYVEKIAAAGIAALSALFLLLTLTRLVSIKVALLGAGLYAFGTATFGVSSQSLWPVGSAQLLLAIALYLLTRGVSDPGWTAYAAVPLSWAVLSRPSTALIGLVIALYILQHRRRQFPLFVLLALPAVAFQLVYNVIYLGNPFLPPGYVSSGHHVLARPENFNTPLVKGLAGLLMSPSVGFFVYSPVFIFALIGIYRRWCGRDPLAPYLTGAALLVILLDSKLNMWWGGTVMGPRYVVEVAPILAYFLAFGVPHEEAMWKKCLFGVLAAWSIYANGLVAFMFDESWDHQADLWAWSNSPIMYYSRHGLDWVSSLPPTLRRQIRQLPDSRSQVGLAADLRVEGLPSEVVTNSLLDVTAHVKNTGQVVWRRRTADGIGTVRFGWRWVGTEGRPEAPGEGRGPWLASDVLPGQRASIGMQLSPPAKPGAYELELGMVSEGVAWFGRDGEMPLRLKIDVAGEPLCPFERALRTMQDPTEPPVHIQWVADRTVLEPHEAFSARLNISNPGPSRVLYPAIVLQWPSGLYSYLHLAQQRFQGICPGWIEHKWPMFVDRGYRAFEYPMLTLLPAGMPAGTYTLYFLYVRPKDARIRLVASTAVKFERVP
jgi:hypothetical protein